MRTRFPAEFIYQIFALLIAIIVVHAFYVAVVRPQAEVLLEEQRQLIESDKSYTPERSVFIIIRDFEQEACFILMLWAMAMIAYKAFDMGRERNLFAAKLLPDRNTAKSILPEDAREYARPVQALPAEAQRRLLPRAISTALLRFSSTKNIHDVSESINNVCMTESDRLESDLSMIRYIAWAIPSIGFIGTVRGIGEALAQAHKAVEGDIVGVTESLGVAFNSTFIALLLSIVLMLLVHQLQSAQERLVLDTQHFCDEALVQKLRTVS